MSNFNHKTNSETLADGESLSVSVGIGGADYVATIVGDGAGGAPPVYDIRWQQRPSTRDDDGNGEWMATSDPSAAEATGTTATWWRDKTPTPSEWRATITNQSGGDATFRLRVISHGGDN